jgi:uncharacterized protein (DUF4415 family)
MRRGLTEIITGKDTPNLEPLTPVNHEEIKKAAAKFVTRPKTEAPAEPPRLTASPFTVDHRAELIKEMRNDADVLDKQAADLTHKALSLRLSADHLEAHPPEP